MPSQLANIFLRPCLLRLHLLSDSVVVLLIPVTYYGYTYCGRTESAREHLLEACRGHSQCPEAERAERVAQVDEGRSRAAEVVVVDCVGCV